MPLRIDTEQLAIDSNALNGLKRSAQQESPEAIRAAAKQFEAVLMNMMLKSMRDTVPQDGMFDNEQSKMFTGMLDQQLTGKLSEKGLGLTDVLVRQLSRVSGQPPVDKTASPTAGHGKVSLSAQHQETPLLSSVASKLRAAYQQWQSPAPAITSTESNTSAADNLLTIPELPTLLGETQDNLQPLTLPAKQVSAVVNRIGDKTSQFIQSMLPHAQSASEHSGIPAKFMIGQAALESGWGKHEIKTADGRTSHNLFGIKADANWTGKTVSSVTTEYVDGIKQYKVEKFRAYDSYSEAFKDYAKLISQNPRYQQAMHNTHNASAYANALQRAGYATDPHYSKKLTQVINKMMG